MIEDVRNNLGFIVVSAGILFVVHWIWKKSGSSTGLLGKKFQ